MTILIFLDRFRVRINRKSLYLCIELPQSVKRWILLSTIIHWV